MLSRLPFMTFKKEKKKVLTRIMLHEALCENKKVFLPRHFNGLLLKSKPFWQRFRHKIWSWKCCWTTYWMTMIRECKAKAIKPDRNRIEMKCPAYFENTSESEWYKVHHFIYTLRHDFIFHPSAIHVNSEYLEARPIISSVKL